MTNANAKTATDPDPSKIPAFDKAMRGLIRVPKSEIKPIKSKPAKRKK